MPAVPLHAPHVSNLSHTRTNPLPALLDTPLGLALFEIQGSLNIPDNTEGPGLRQKIGKVAIPLLDSGEDNASVESQEGPWMKQVYFYVGDRQRLVGEVKRLDKPIGILKKRTAGDQQRQQPQRGEGDELEVVDIIKWKVYFGNRPEFV